VKTSFRSMRLNAASFATVLLLALAVDLCALCAESIKLPGTQPMEHKFEFRAVTNCMMCHAETPNGKNDPFFSWQGGMMAQAARDPGFRAALAVANQDQPGSGEFCIRCHSPRGWLEGASAVTDGSALTNDYLNGVSCDVCHHLVDPFSDDAKKLVQSVPPGYGNGMMVVNPERVQRGPYGDPNGMKMHATMQSAYHASGELCGTCHNVSNPTLATNVNTQPPYSFGHIERTYSEWALSDFAKPESLQSCQSCHFLPVPGGGMAVRRDSNYGTYHRDHFVSHNAVGGSTWVQDAVYRIWKGKDLDREALDAGKENARALLKTATALRLEIAQGKAHLTITNLTGHKFPTGYPEGRRAWVNVRFYGTSSNLISEVGRYGEVEARLKIDENLPWNKCRAEIGGAIGNRILGGGGFRVPTLLDPDRTRVYECKPALSAEQAAKHRLKPGPSFHFILNDVIAKDNRIPPRGYRRTAFAEHLAATVDVPVESLRPGEPAQTVLQPGAALSGPIIKVVRASDSTEGYADRQFWDDLEFDVPARTESVEVRLMYQSVSWEYLKFLTEENRTDCWGLKLFAAWLNTDKCPPEEIAFVAKRVQP